MKSFMEVAKHKSFTKASAHSYLTQPSLSKAIKKIEEELHVQLFDRSTRQLQLTDAGRVVYQQGQKVLASLSELDILLDELKNIVAGEIKIGIPPLIGILFFPDIARRLHEKHPKISLELVEHGAKSIAKLVEEGKVDLGIVVMPANSSKFHIYPFFEDEFVLFLHHEHRFAERTSVSMEDLKDENFILFSESFTLHDFVIRACEQGGFTPMVSYRSSQWDLIVELVSSKLGITLLPKIIFDKQSNRNVKIIPIENATLRWRLGIITKKGAYHSYALKELLKILVNDAESIGNSDDKSSLL